MVVLLSRNFLLVFFFSPELLFGSSCCCAFLLRWSPAVHRQERARASAIVLHKERLALRAVSSSSTVDQDSGSVPKTSSMNAKADDTNTNDNPIVDRSTLTLLEHINLNVPDHRHILPFYLQLLGCGLDPRRAANLRPGAKSQTVWANCGASQFHLPYGDPAQRVPGLIGLRIRPNDNKWHAFVERCRQEQQKALPSDSGEATNSCIQSMEEGGGAAAAANDGEQQQPAFVRLVDHYGNVFLCRPDNDDKQQQQQQSSCWNAQPIIAQTDTDAWGDIARRYGRRVDDGGTTDCTGIDFVEFRCPVGASRKIAQFYENVLDATVSVVRDSRSTGDSDSGGAVVAVIAIGNVRANGRADQSLLFRETTGDIPPYDGHHIALYVGETAADFEQAFKNAATAGVVWVNPRFSDKADTLDGARRWKQFRFKDIVDLETGEVVMELEHELRSCEHEACPGIKAAVE